MREELHEVQHPCPSGFRGGRLEALPEDLPALRWGVARLVLHRGARVSHAAGHLLLRESRGVRRIPQCHARTKCKGQLRTITRISQDDLCVVPRSTTNVLGPTHLVLWAHARLLVPLRRGWRTHYRPILSASRERVVEHVQDRREGLVAQGKVPVMVGTSLTPVSHAYDLIPHGSAEDSLAARHQEPHGRGLCMSPRQAVEAVHVTHESGPTRDHLLPIVVNWAEQERGDVHGHTTISS
mmetsp:Transcript_78463/g.230098  ORF Transcript_78463/g.230098 Transcript_78463/m.230098 type:complete len:239 (-) Transcript_78463:1137-1853(-)